MLGIDHIVGGDYDSSVIELAAAETLAAVNAYDSDFAKRILKALSRIPHVRTVPALCRSILEQKGIRQGYDRPLDDEWHTPRIVATDSMLGVVTGYRTLEPDYPRTIPCYWRQWTTLLRDHRIFWFGDFHYATLCLPLGLPNWSGLARVMGAGFELGVCWTTGRCSGSTR